MTNIDAPSVVRKWFSDWTPHWHARSIAAELRLSDEPATNKAMVGLEVSTHVASITAWGSGMLEFIVLELASKTEVIMSDNEYRTAEDLRKALDDCADSFDRILGAT